MIKRLELHGLAQLAQIFAARSSSEIRPPSINCSSATVMIGFVIEAKLNIASTVVAIERKNVPGAVSFTKGHLAPQTRARVERSPRD